MSTLDTLFSPFLLKGLNLPNRVVMAPMTRSFSPGGVPSEQVAAYYRRRAEGGVGLILTEATGIGRASSVNEPDVPLFHGKQALAGWRRVVDEVHAAGGRIMPQFWHVGGKRSANQPDWQPPAPYESPSGFSVTGEPLGTAMSERDIANTITAFADAAAVAEELGFDGIELHGGHGYLINQFLFDHLNLRRDRYGGTTLIERSLFAIEVLRAIRARVSPDFPILFRLSQWKPQAFDTRIAADPYELGGWLALLAEAGADAFHCSQRHYWDVAFPEVDASRNLAGWAKKLTGLPAITVGSVGLSGDVYGSFAGRSFAHASLDSLLARLDAGEFDLVAVGRPLLQHPDWLDKVRLGQTRDIAAFTPDVLKRLY